MKRYFSVIARLAQMLTRQFFRDKVAMFFTFIFPLIFLLVFGSLNRNNNGVSFDVVVINQSQTAFAQQFIDELKESNVVKETQADSLDDAKEKMSRGEADTILVLPEAFGEPNEKGQPTGKAEVYFSPSSA